MNRTRYGIFAGILAAALAAAPAGAETTIPVNAGNTGVFDQPSVAMSGSTAHVAFIGDNSASGTYRVYYAAVNGGADFTNLSLPRDNTVILTFPTPVDNVSAGDLYFDARHPKIAMRSSSEAVILFQARPSGPGDDFRPYLARVTLSGNTVLSVSVTMVRGFPAPLDSGNVEDISFGLVASDNTARIAYDYRASGSTGNFDVYYARVSLDNAFLTGTPGIPLLLSGTASSGFRPLPALKLDALHRAHVAWANNSNPTTAGSIYYSLVKETSGADNVVIAASPVIGSPAAWGHPNVLVSSQSSIIILAADETFSPANGDLAMVNINPDADNQDGTPAEVGTNSSFFLTPPGEAILPDFRVYRPEAFLDPSGRIHVTGYGVSGTYPTYFVFRTISTSPFAEFVKSRNSVGAFSGEPPGELPQDYSKTAFGYLSGKALFFWSGEGSGGNRNLNVTSLATVTEPVPVNESGCSSAPGHGAGIGTGGILLLIPAALFGMRRRFRRDVDG